MIDGLIGGKLHGKPMERTSKSGNAYVTCIVRVATEADPLFVSVIAFDKATCAALLALDAGDSVALSGTLTPKVYVPNSGGEARPALDMVAQAVLTAYHVTRKRKAVAESAA